MPSGMPNPARSKARQLYAERKITWDELLDVEAKSYHAPGTCTFYGTANSNQMLMEIMGLHIPGASFVNPDTPLRDALTRAATARALAITAQGNEYTPVGAVIDERAIVNGVVGLHATGGSTNHTLHLVAAAKAAGIRLTWDDFADLSEVVPLLARVYPNGNADVNDFHKAGGMQYLMRELLGAGLLHEDVRTAWGTGLDGYLQTPVLDDDGAIVWNEGRTTSGDETVLRPAADPFSPEGGLALLDGNLGRAVIKVSAVKPEHQVVEAPALIFHSQEELERGLPRRPARARLRRRRPLPGAEGQRHAGTPQADADARRPAGPRLQGGAAHRRPHVGRQRQGAGGDPCDAGGRRRRADRQAPRRRHRPPRSAARPAPCLRRSGGIQRPRSRRPPTSPATNSASAASCSACSAPTPSRRRWGQGCFRPRQVSERFRAHGRVPAGTSFGPIAGWR